MQIATNSCSEASKASAFSARSTTLLIFHPSFSVIGLHWTQRSEERPESEAHDAS